MLGKVAVMIAVIGLGAFASQGAQAHRWHGYDYSQDYYVKTTAYDRGYANGACDATACQGFGYSPNCPPDHSSDYCNNYNIGYRAGWNSVAQTTSNDASAAIGGNKINGDDNVINQQIIQQQGSRTSSSSGDNNDGGDGGGQNPRCKLFCVGVN